MLLLLCCVLLCRAADDAGCGVVFLCRADDDADRQAVVRQQNKVAALEAQLASLKVSLCVAV